MSYDILIDEIIADSLAKLENPQKRPPKRSRFGSNTYFRQNKTIRGSTRKAQTAYRVTLPSHHVRPYEGEYSKAKSTATVPAHNFIDGQAELRPLPFSEPESKVYEDYPVNAKLGYRVNRTVDF